MNSIPWRARLLALPLAALGLTLNPSGAHAQTVIDQPYRYSEVRLGVLAHDIRGSGGESGTVDLNLEVTSSTLVSPSWTGGAPQWLQWALHPRLHFGLEPSLGGRTSQLYFGATWSGVLATGLALPGDQLEFGGEFGPSVNDGDHHTYRRGHVSLGSNVLFHTAGEIDYRFIPRAAIGVYVDHSSNAGLARDNGGLTDLGLRLSVRF